MASGALADPEWPHVLHSSTAAQQHNHCSSSGMCFRLVCRAQESAQASGASTVPKGMLQAGHWMVLYSVCAAVSRCVSG